MISEIIKQACEDKIMELEANKKIIEKACETLENKLKTEKKEYGKIIAKIGELKDFLNKEAAEQEGDPKMTVEAKKAYDHERYVKRKRKAKAEEAAQAPTITTEAESEQSQPEIKAAPCDDILTINAKARACGMSYGKYMAKQQIERQHEEMAEARRRRKLLAGGDGNDSEGIPGKD